MNIIEQMIEDKIAKNPFQATHIANGLKLYELATDDERVARYKLYRKWRDAGEPSKVAYQNAIDGTDVVSLDDYIAESNERIEKVMLGEAASAQLDDDVNGEWQVG